MMIERVLSLAVRYARLPLGLYGASMVALPAPMGPPAMGRAAARLLCGGPPLLAMQAHHLSRRSAHGRLPPACPVAVQQRTICMQRACPAPWSACTLGPPAQRRPLHIRSSIHKRCDGCYFARRKGRLYLRCRVHARHKQRQGRASLKQTQK